MLGEDSNMVTNENGGEHQESIALDKLEEGMENLFLQFGLSILFSFLSPLISVESFCHESK